MTRRALTQFEPAGAGGATLIREPSIAAHGASNATYIGLVDFLRILRRRSRLIIGVIATVMLLTIFALTQITPIYSTSAVLMIEPLKDPVAAAAASPVTAKPDEEIRIATKMELMQSRALARKVARNMRLVEDPEFAPDAKQEPGLVSRVLQWISPAAPSENSYASKLSSEDISAAEEQASIEAVTDKLMSKIAVERVAKSHIISVSASSSDPFKASLIANRFAETHIKGQKTEEENEREANIEELTKRVGDLREKLKASDASVASYKRDNNLVVARTEEMNAGMLGRLQGALAEAQAAAAQSAARANAIVSGAATTASSPLLNDLKSQEAVLGKRVAELSSFYGRGHPDLVNAQAQLDEVRSRLTAEQARAIAAVDQEAATIRSSGGAGLSTLASSIGTLRSANAREQAATVGLKDLERDSDTSHALYMSLLSQLKDVSGKVTGERPDMRIVSRAPIPDAPSHPEPKRTLAIALLGSLMLALILAFVAENLDSRIRTADQVDHLLGLPTLAMIPDVTQQTLTGPAYALVRGQPRSVFSESVRNLYIELLSRAERPGSQVVVVTSPLANEGKSTIATSLAAAATTLGHSAVVLDVDLRQPAMAQALLGASPDADVVAYLTDRAALDELLDAEPKDPEQFVQIGASEPASDPGALISSPRLAKLISQLRERFDLVVLNAPPILPVRDAKILSSYSDAALLVLRWGKTHPDAARVALELFGDKLTGAVINRVDYREHARRNYGDAIHYYAQYAGYYGDAGGLERPSWRIFDRALGRGEDDGQRA